MIRLKKSDRALIRKVARNDVERTFTGLQRFLRNSCWIGKTNRYSVKTIARIKAEILGGNIRSPRELARYIAAGSVLHCADGWTYLGKALNALLRGDPHNVRHLAYYAELRAALSILASEGIGILNRQHFVISGADQVKEFARSPRMGTHEIAWECLQYWSGRNKSGPLFTKVIRPMGIPLERWLTPIAGVQIAGLRAEGWFKDWGIDLKIFADDREARNESSYRPDGIPSVWEIDASRALDFADGLWRALEPTEGALFNIVDRHIFRTALEEMFRGRHGIAAQSDRTRFSTYIAPVLDDSGLDIQIRNELGQFLIRQTHSEDLDLIKCSRLKPDDKDGYLGMLARATLLLRIAAGSSLLLIEKAELTSDNLAFWWESLGRGRGIWEGAKGRSELLDLYADVTSLLDDIGKFRNDFPNVADRNFYQISKKLPAAVVALSGCEKIAIWSLTP